MPLAIALLASLAAPTHAQSGTGPEQVEVANRFVAAWNAHDAVALGRLVAADADWVTASGLRVHGRAKIQDYLAREHATWAKTTTMRVVSIHVRPLSTGAASVFLEWEIVEDAGVAGAGPTARRGNYLFVVMREGAGWIIVAGQVARAPAPKP